METLGLELPFCSGERMRSWTVFGLLFLCACTRPSSTYDKNWGHVPPRPAPPGADSPGTAPAPQPNQPPAPVDPGPGSDAPPDAGSGENPPPPDLGPAPGPVVSCDPAGHARTVAVHTAAQLTAALSGAKPGDLIQLADGTYVGSFSAAISGTAAAPITLCGSRQAILQGAALTSGRTFHLTADYWALSGFVVTQGLKGIMLDNANHNILSSLEVHHIGDEGVHFRTNSSDNLLVGSSVHDTGAGNDPHSGEGVYIGSAAANWCTYTNCNPDKSDRNQILNNQLGPNTTAENLDIKEGTSGGIVKGNHFDGTGMDSPASADSWVDAKGNGYLISDNTGDTTPNDGIQTHVIKPGWGQANIFHGNNFDLGDAPGYGFRIQPQSLNTVLGCDNMVINAALGMSNLTCTQ
jgi:hypothetical protein